MFLRRQVEGAQDTVDVVVGDQFQFEPAEQRVTFPAGDDVWALRLGTRGAFDRFLASYNKALFENRFGVEQTEANQTKVGAARGAAPLRAPSQRVCAFARATRRSWATTLCCSWGRRPTYRAQSGPRTWTLTSHAQQSCARPPGTTSSRACSGRPPPAQWLANMARV